ncbi:MAG: aminotransferase class V-fold PLP-dependent enzyme [Candidatus Hodarchaeota archaeon]
MNLEELREQFPVTDKAIYLNHAAIGPSPIPVIEECKKLLIQHKLYGELYSGSLSEMLDQLDQDRKIIGKFINARYPEEEIAFTYNTSYGLAAIAEGIDWKKGDRIILNDLEYTSNSYTYQALAKKWHLDLEIVQNIQGRLLLDKFVEKIKKPTRLVAISHVQFSNGFRVDLKELSRICHENDVQLIVDAIQSLGAIPLDVKTQAIDYLATGGYKWLLGPLSTGFIYIKRELADELNPSFIGSMSDTNPLNLSHHTYSPATGAKRFQASLDSNPQLITKAVEFLDNIGINNIFRHIMKLTDLAIELVQNESSFHLKTPIEDTKCRSGIINFSCQSGDEIVNKLRKLPTPIVISYREGGLRLSPHCYNSEEEIEITLRTIKSLNKK